MRKSYDATCDKAESRIKERWERGREFNGRLGRPRGPMTRYYERIKRAKLNELATETNWRGDLARSVKDVIEGECDDAA
jgi:hypothetical protein